MTSRTINNLGVDISTRYAQDREAYDETFIRDARGIPDQTKVSITEPAYSSEFDMLFGLGAGKTSWSSFVPPLKYRASRRRLFAEQLIPALGSPEKQETQIQRLKSFPTETSEITAEKEKLLSLLNNVHDMDKWLIDINSRRSQYQKG